MPRIAVILSVLALAACGADAPPLPVNEDPERRGGIEISGTAEIGITGGAF